MARRMSDGIHLLSKIIRNLTNQDGKPSAPPGEETPDLPDILNRREHGAVYSSLDWQNQRAADRQQRTHESYQGERFPANPTGDGDESNFSNFRQSNSETIPFRQPDSDQNNFPTARQNSSNYAHDSGNYANSRSARNYSNAKSTNFNQNDESFFNALQNQTENARARIIRMSEPHLVEVEIDGRIEMRQISHFDELVQLMKSLNLTPREFAETLPPEEREAFPARFQTSQISIGERPAQTTADKLPLENKSLTQSEIRPEKINVQTTQTGTAETLTAQTVKENSSGSILQNTLGKAVENPKNILTAEKSFNALSEANLKTASGATNLGAVESLNARVLNNQGAENSLIPNTLTKRETGEILGGALINGALTAVGEHENAEIYRIGDSPGRGNYYGASASGFAAGATGSLLSAAIGRVIPGAGTDVGGILGFVSGVVVGVEINEGLRWLGASNSISGTTIFESNLITENSAAPNFNLQTRFA